MALYQGHIFIPRRLRSEDLAQLNDYQSQIDSYKDSYDAYKQQVEDYNKAIETWNKGPRTSPFEGVAPTAPAEPGFKQEDIDAFQDEALGRATQRQSQLQTAVNVAQNPEAYGFGGFGFREGGMVPAYSSYGGGGNSGGIMSVLQPFGDYLNEQIDVQRVDPFLETVSNAAYQEFGIKPDQGGGGGFFSGDFYKTNLGGDFSGMPPPLPDVQQPVMNMDTELPGPVASLSNFGPDVGNGGLFGGGPMSGGTPTQLPGPRIPTFTGTGNDGFGSASQGPLDFYNPATGINEIPRPIGDIAQPTQPGYGGQPMQLPYDPTPMNPLIMDSFVAAGGTLPDFAGSAQNYFGPMDSRGPSTPMTPEDILRQAQGRLMQMDVKPPEVDAYLQHVIETGGRPTMMAPKPDFSNLVSVLPGGGLITGQPGAGFGMPDGNGPGGVTLRPIPGAMPVEAFMGGSSTFDESAPYPISMQLARSQFG
jgi:hypothetical protein